MCDFSKIVLPNVTRSREIISEVREIRAKPVMDDSDTERIAVLKIELLGLCPALRYAWREAVPIVDLWAELINFD